MKSTEQTIVNESEKAAANLSKVGPNKKIKALKEERELIINAKSLSDVGISSKEARHKINELIRGIDKCIAQLNL